MNYDEDMVNQISLENWHELEDELKEKNRILRMSNSERKRKEWQRLFGIVETTLTDEVY